MPALRISCVYETYNFNGDCAYANGFPVLASVVNGIIVNITNNASFTFSPITTAQKTCMRRYPVYPITATVLTETRKKKPCNLYKDSDRTAQKAQRAYILKTIRLMSYRNTTVDYYTKHTEHTETLCVKHTKTLIETHRV
jgi:hypothetical protein